MNIKDIKNLSIFNNERSIIFLDILNQIKKVYNKKPNLNLLIKKDYIKHNSNNQISISNLSLSVPSLIKIVLISILSFYLFNIFFLKNTQKDKSDYNTAPFSNRKSEKKCKNSDLYYKYKSTKKNISIILPSLPIYVEKLRFKNTIDTLNHQYICKELLIGYRNKNINSYIVSVEDGPIGHNDIYKFSNLVNLSNNIFNTNKFKKCIHFIDIYIGNKYEKTITKIDNKEYIVLRVSANFGIREEAREKLKTIKNNKKHIPTAITAYMIDNVVLDYISQSNDISIGSGDMNESSFKIWSILTKQGYAQIVLYNKYQHLRDQKCSFAFKPLGLCIDHKDEKCLSMYSNIKNLIINK